MRTDVSTQGGGWLKSLVQGCNNYLAAQRRDYLFLRALSSLRGSIFNSPKRGVGA